MMKPSREDLARETKSEPDDACEIPLPFLAATAGVCGAGVMALEVLGSRVIGPFFGVSLFVWTGLISVTLLSLALGYAIGGRLADRNPSPSLLYGLIAASGVCVLSIPVLRDSVLLSSAGLGLRTGALAASTLLFGPSLLLLGCVSPFAVRLSRPKTSEVGFAVGLLSAISTSGSFVGTLLTGFLLIPRFGVSRILQLTGGLLLALAALWFVFFARRRSAALLLLLPILSPGNPPLRSLELPSGTRATEVFRKDTFYGLLKVVEYSFGSRKTREMTIDGLVQGGIDTNDGRSVYEYSYALEWLPRALHRDPRRALVIGLGAGIVPARLERDGIRTDVVDIDPEVVDVARRYFEFKSSGRVILEDGRAFLSRGSEKWDLILLDVFNGDITPTHLLSREALSAARTRLEPGGVLAINVIGTTGGEPAVISSIHRTLRAVFQQVTVLSLAVGKDPDNAANLIFCAYDGPIRPIAWEGFPGSSAHPMASEVLVRARGNIWVPAPGAGVVLTDDYDPLDLAGVALRERLRQNILTDSETRLLL